jgi:signal transduction histidine kinase
MTHPGDHGRLPAEELRSLFLFESLTDDQLAELAALGQVESHDAGTVLYREGEAATCFYVLLEGELVLSRRVRDGDVEINRTSYRGAYCGATAAYAGDAVPQVYTTSVRLTTDGRFLVLPAEDLARLLRAWFPMAIHLLEGLLLGTRRSETVVSQRERLLALGQLSAGLTHELNNPAAAAARATAALRERVAGMRHKLGKLATGAVEPVRLQQIVVLQESTVERQAKSPRLSPLERGDLEDELADWMDERDVSGGYDLAPVFAAGGLGVDWAEDVAAAVDDPADLEPALRWLAYSVETEQLMREIEDATTRISTLLASVRQYSGMDRAPFEETDLRAGLESTLAILGHKLGPGITVVRDWDEEVPAVPAYGGELNQVWTNLVDNALAAMAGEGTLTVRVRHEPGPDGGYAVVEIGDTGPGVPDEIVGRIFEPFFTTKPQGEGTGLGLDISYRIVVDRHGGDLTVRSRPGETWFSARLPLVRS